MEKGDIVPKEGNIFSLPEIDWGKCEHYIHDEGFYFYGGKGNGSENGKDLFILHPVNESVIG